MILILLNAKARIAGSVIHMVYRQAELYKKQGAYSALMNVLLVAVFL